MQPHQPKPSQNRMHTSMMCRRHTQNLMEKDKRDMSAFIFFPGIFLELDVHVLVPTSWCLSLLTKAKK